MNSEKVAQKNQSSTSRFFFFNDTATTEIYTLSLHDALPISPIATIRARSGSASGAAPTRSRKPCSTPAPHARRSEEHTSELQSQSNLVCRLLLEKKKTSAQSRAHLDRKVARRESRHSQSASY